MWARKDFARWRGWCRRRAERGLCTRAPDGVYREPSVRAPSPKVNPSVTALR